MKLYISPSSQEHNVGPNGYIEETYMNQVADILCPELTRHGIEWMRNNRDNTYVGHIEESNAYHPDYHIAIHSNAGGTTARGCTMYAYKPDTYPDKPGPMMAKSIYKYLEALTPVDDRGVQDGSSILSEVAKTTAPAVLMEVDFHDKEDGAAWIVSHIPEIADAILRGILDQCGIAYIPVVQEIDYKAMYEKAMADFASLSAQTDAICLRRDQLAAERDKLSGLLADQTTRCDQETQISQQWASKASEYLADCKAFTKIENDRAKLVGKYNSI